ncbi:MAG: class A beta-lactamase-related serine hydrolase [Actinomycetota bacterium]|nr:class A beta-lactamase-related serine hydrolase [Actinomycetota bacterium]
MFGERQPVLDAALAGVSDASGFRAGICARGLEGPLSGWSVGVDEELASPSASLIKVPILVALLREADRRSLSLDEALGVRREDLVEDSEMLETEELPARVPVRRLAEGMITLSDNAATNLLIRRIGMERVNDLAHDLGLRSTCLRRKMMDPEARARGEENLTSASDMVVLLGEIWRGSFLSPESKALALELLLGQRMESRVPVALPPGARYAHKTGELQGVENDAGLVLLPGRTFALAVLVEGDVERAVPPVAATVSVVCEAFAAFP